MTAGSLPAAVEALGERLDEQGSTRLLCALFRLTPFERSLVLLCAGVEMDEEIARLCEVEATVPHATFGLALARLPSRTGARSRRVARSGTGGSSSRTPVRS